MTPTFFKTPAAFRRWLARHPGKSSELFIGFYKAGSAKVAMTYRQALDEALCSGWIDGVRKGLDDDSFVVRFTPRKKKSYWSAVNLKRASELIAAGAMRKEGLAALAARADAKERYSFEAKREGLDAAARKALAANQQASEFFAAQIPSYQRTAAFWVMSAKKEETRAKRLQVLIESSTHKKAIPPLRWGRVKA